MSPNAKLKVDLITGIARRKLPSNQLPSELNIVSYFRLQHENQKLPFSKSIQIVSTEAVAIWNTFGLPHPLRRNIVLRVNKLVVTWQRLSKMYKRQNLKASFQMCKMRMSNFFNISVKHIEKELQNDAVRSEFWCLQKQNKFPVKVPKSFLSSIPSTCKQCIEKKPRKVEKSPVERRGTVREPFVEENATELRRSKRLKLFTNAVVENLDRTRVSNRGAVGVLAATAVAFGLESEMLSLSKSTLHRKRKLVIYLM